MTSTRIFAALNAGLSVIQSVFLSTSVVVFDGPQPQFPTDQDFIVWGCDNVLAEGMIQAVTNGDQEWLDLGSSLPTIKESFTLLGTYVTWTGDNDFPTLRSNADTNLGLLEAGIRPNVGPTDPDGQLGTNSSPGPLGPTGWCQLSVRDVQIVSSNQGTAMHVTFGIDCWTRI